MVRTIGPILQMKELRHREGKRVLLRALPTVSGRCSCRSQSFVLFSFSPVAFFSLPAPRVAVLNTTFKKGEWRGFIININSDDTF